MCAATVRAVTTENIIGIGALAVLAVSAVVAVRSRRVWPRRIAAVGVLAGWSAVGQFLLAPLVSARVLAFVLLGGIVAAILTAAVVGTLRSRGK